MEIERKFLVKRDNSFRAMASSASEIAQGYMDVKGATVRIRMRDNKAYLTIKGPSHDGGISRYEFEREIPVDDAKAMMKLCKGGTIEKTRYLVPYNGHIWEVDEFKGANEGLLFAEIELDSVDESFDIPPFIGPEVTGNRNFYNKHLLAAPYPTWKATLPEDFQ